MIMELVRNRSSTFTTGNGRRSRQRRLKNVSVPQGSVLAPCLFNIYTHDLPATISRRYAYADDLAILYAADDWNQVAGTLRRDMTTLSAYLQNWRLDLNEAKTVSAAFHFNNKEAQRELKSLVRRKTVGSDQSHMRESATGSPAQWSYRRPSSLEVQFSIPVLTFSSYPVFVPEFVNRMTPQQPVA